MRVSTGGNFKPKFIAHLENLMDEGDKCEKDKMIDNLPSKDNVHCLMMSHSDDKRVGRLLFAQT
jgi:hypothetical protein